MIAASLLSPALPAIMLSVGAVAATPGQTAEAIRLAPPIDQPMMLEVVSENSMRSGRMIRFAARYRLRFIQEEGQLLLEARLIGTESDAPPIMATLFERLLANADQPMLAMVRTDDGALVPLALPAKDGAALIAQLGTEKADGGGADGDGATDLARIAAPDQSAWLADIATLLRFANVDMTALARGNALQLEHSDAAHWQFGSRRQREADQVRSEYVVARATGLVTRAKTEIRSRDSDPGRERLIMRKTLTLTAG